MQNDTLRSRLADLPHPDYVGQAEYRAVYDYLWDLIDSGLSDEDILESLLELRAVADSIYSDLAGGRERR